MKDNFSFESDKYAKFRPRYPAEFFDFINTVTPKKENAWDCATGNGQIASELATTFKQVYATDISESQIENASKVANIHYSLQRAEKTGFKENWFDLVTVGQAIHWFDFESFYEEVRRTARNGALICAVGYGKIEIEPAINAVINHFYTDIIGEFWDEERRYIDQEYQTIPFPFEEIETPQFEIRELWSFKRLIGYLRTWSAVRHFVNRKGYNPVDDLQNQLEPFWPYAEKKDVCFPLLLRMGRIIDSR